MTPSKVKVSIWRYKEQKLLVVLFEKHSTGIHLTESTGVSGPHMLKRYQRKDLSGRVTNKLFIVLHFFSIKVVCNSAFFGFE